jgi:metallo-beta-lactamase class B
MKKLLYTLIAFYCCAFTGYAQEAARPVIVSEDLEIIPLSKKSLIHVSYLNTNSFGRVACNGLIYMDGNEALIMDTPATNETTLQLMDWLAKTYPGLAIKGIVATHFHDDCLAGLDALHQAGVPSYSSVLTAELARKTGVTVPQRTFEKQLPVTVGRTKVMCQYLGEGHTRDNIIAWIPGENIIFGGCLVKSMNATKGNLADANVQEWSNTVSRVKNTYKRARIVIPGHGPHGGTELLDFTIQLFSQPN